MQVARAVKTMFRLGTDMTAAVNNAVTRLSEGNVIAIPTDTVYGLAASAQDEKAIQRLYKIKHRDEKNPVAICVPQVSDVSRWGEAKHLPNGLLQDLLPGPVTVILRRSSELNPSLNPDNTLVGIRVPDDAFVRAIAARFGGPIALTSANRSAEPSSLNPSEFKTLWPMLSAIFDGGTLPSSRLGSTVINLCERDVYHIIRDGSALEATTNCLQKYGLTSKKISK